MWRDSLLQLLVGCSEILLTPPEEHHLNTGSCSICSNSPKKPKLGPLSLPHIVRGHHFELVTNNTGHKVHDRLPGYKVHDEASMPGNKKYVT